MLRVHGEVVAPFGELDRAAPPHVGNAIDLRNLPLVPAYVVEDQPFPERQVAERQLVGAEPAKDRVEEDRAGDDEVRAPGIESRHLQPALESRSQTSLRTRRSCLAEMRRFRSSAGGVPRAAVAATTPRLRIVPDVPTTRSKPMAVI